MLNVVTVMGRLVADPQLRQTPGGRNVCSFRIACDRGRRDESGHSMADFFDVVAWQGTADFVCRYFGKGALIALDGRLQSRSYQDRNGTNRQVVEIVAQNVHFTGERNTRPAAPAVDEGGQAGPEPTPAPMYPAGDDDYTILEDDGDLPF